MNNNYNYQEKDLFNDYWKKHHYVSEASSNLQQIFNAMKEGNYNDPFIKHNSVDFYYTDKINNEANFFNLNFKNSETKEELEFYKNKY